MLSSIVLMKYNEDMKKEKLQDNLYWLFMVASFKAKKGFIKLADEHDLTVVQLYALCSMEPQHPVPMKEIANLLNCDASNVTGIIDRLFSHNYIVRVEKPDDRRVKMALLTPKGEQLRQKLVEGIIGYRSDRLERLSDERKEQLKELLIQILRPD
jgi:DNA-binding MarR family transcriptional regulator